MVELSQGARRDACIAILIIVERTGGRLFTVAEAADMLLKNQSKMRYHDKERGIKQKRDMRIEDAAIILRKLKENGFIEFVHTRYPDPKNPNDKTPRGGISYWRINPLRLSECQNTQWYKAHTRRIEWKQREQNLDKQMCRALNFINGLFGEQPFTYNMLKNAVDHMRNTSPYQTEREKELIRGSRTINEFDMSPKNDPLTGSRNPAPFLQIWNSLIRNNYIKEYKRRETKKFKRAGSKEKEYYVNKIYLRKCVNVK